jgi:hypothetical protein
MTRLDSTAPVTQAQPRQVTTAEHVGGAALGFAAFVAVLCAIAGIRFDVAWKLVIAAGVLPVVIGSAGALRQVLERALPAVELAMNWDIDGNRTIGTVGQDIRIIPIRGVDTMHVSGNGRIDMDDLRFMVERLDIEKQTGWTVRECLGLRLPSGREIVSVDVGPYAEFIEILQRIGAIVDRSERSKGRLVMSASEILAALRL